MNLFNWPIILWIKILNKLHLGKQKFDIFYVPAQRILPFHQNPPRAATEIGNTTEETVNVNETNPVPVEETEPAENTEKIS